MPYFSDVQNVLHRLAPICTIYFEEVSPCAWIFLWGNGNFLFDSTMLIAICFSNSWSHLLSFESTTFQLLNRTSSSVVRLSGSSFAIRYRWWQVDVEQHRRVGKCIPTSSAQTSIYMGSPRMDRQGRQPRQFFLHYRENAWFAPQRGRCLKPTNRANHIKPPWTGANQ